MAASTKALTADGAHVTTVADETAAAAPPPAEPEFPLHAMKVADFLKLDTLRPHNALKAEGLVVALDFDGEHKGVHLNFVSHQSLAYAEADPNNDHLKTMQDVFRRVISGESIFKSDDDWSAYTKGACEENARWSALAHAWSISPEEFKASIGEGWVWMDYICIPQVINAPSEEVPAILAEQAAAIQAIPSYVRHATHFWICAPSGAMHVDTCVECNYDSWHSRGWCRMEEAALNLERLGDGRALLVTQPLGDPPAVATFDKIDRAWNKTQRHASPLTGAYSCCRLGHVVTSADGVETKIGCDKLALKGVLHQLFDRKVSEIRKDVEGEGGADLTFAERMDLCGNQRCNLTHWLITQVWTHLIQQKARAPTGIYGLWWR